MAVDQLKNLLHLSNNQLSKITLFKTESNKPLAEREMLCFLKFHNYEMMQDFIEYHKNKNNTFSGYKSGGYKSSTKDEKTKKRKESTSTDPEKAKRQLAAADKKEETGERKTTSDESPRKKSSHKVEFKLNSEEEKDSESKINILEP